MKPFDCPGNTANQCNPKQSGGFDFNDCKDGPLGSYNDFNFNGFTVQDGFGKRDRYDRRTVGKALNAVCGGESEPSNPSFGCDGKNVDKFSLGEISVDVEFDCDLEFHYTMPDKSTCKQRSSCKKGGSVVKNSQCGGAKSVSIVYPSQPAKPTKCSIGVHSMSFHCTTTTKPPPTYTPPTSQKTTSTPETTSTSTPQTTYQQTTPSTSSSPETTTSPSKTLPPAESTPATSPPIYQNTTRVIESTTYQQSTPSTTVIYETPSTSSKPIESGPPTYTASTSSSPIKSGPPTYTASTSTGGVVTTPTYKTTESTPTPTLPCPNVVPQCINTFLFTKTCKDNTDVACYCPDTVFVENIFTCIYAHGESDTIVSEAILFFQGICAPYVPKCPAIVTGASVTSYITVTQTPQVTATYTTITYQATTTVPCTDSQGVTIPNSYSTTVISTVQSYPQINFTTGTAGTVGIIPVTTPVQAGVDTSTPTPTAATTLSLPTPVGTGGLSSPTGGVVTVNAGGRTSAGLGLAGAAVMAVLVWLGLLQGKEPLWLEALECLACTIKASSK